MSQINVDAIRASNGTGDAISLTASDKTCTANITNNLSNRNLIINGAMNVAQRATSSTTNGYGSVDRWKCLHANTDEAPTSAQHALTSSDTGPWAAGFRNSFHITNGNQTSGLGDPDYILFRQVIEAQNIANSGWNYTSASSYLTLSFWVKSSVAQNFYGTIRSKDGTSQNYPFETGSLTADTWTKITKTIPGNANLTFDNNNGEGMEVEVNAAFGGNYTDAGVSLNTWAAYASATINPVNTATWYTTNDSTFEITGVQLEVGDYATDFEHRSYGDELVKCQRYYQQYPSAAWVYKGATSISYGHACMQDTFSLPTPMRSTPVGQPINGTGTVTVRTWNSSYAGQSDVEMYVAENIQNGTVNFNLCYNQDNNSSAVLSNVMGELIEHIEFDAEL